MGKFENLDLPAIMDPLALQTEFYTRILAEGGSASEFNACKELIHDLQQEIESRKHVKENKSVSGLRSE